MLWTVYIISWIQWDDLDLSTNMINKISLSDLLFVEEKTAFDRLIWENKITFNWLLIEMGNDFILSDSFKKDIIWYILLWKNIWIFESSWTACFMDPGYQILEYLYKLKEKVNFDITPIPGTSALTLAISVSWFNIEKFVFGWFLSNDSKFDILHSKIPYIYFNKLNVFDTYNKLKKNISFMDDIDDRYCFIWINLWKKTIKNSNTLIRGSYKIVYEKLSHIYNLDDNLDDITFIFT